jgi:hypothetical protein
VLAADGEGVIISKKAIKGSRGGFSRRSLMFGG